MTPGLDRTRDLLKISLECAVPLRMMEMLHRNPPGPTEWEWDQLPRIGENLAYGEDTHRGGTHPGGEYLMFRHPKEPGVTAQLFNELAFALAVLSFAPGGVRFLGQEWKAEGEYYCPPDIWDRVDKFPAAVRPKLRARRKRDG